MFFLSGAPDKPKTGTINNNNKQNGHLITSGGDSNRLLFEPSNFSEKKIDSGSGNGNTKPPSTKETGSGSGSEVQGGIEQTSQSNSQGGQGLRPIHKGGPEQQKAIDYAWEISKDPLFIYTLKAENGHITIDRRSDKIGKNGWYDYGYCQVNKGYHPKVVNDPRFFTDMKWQLDQCYRLFKGGTTFYGKNRVLKEPAYAKKIKAAFTWE